MYLLDIYFFLAGVFAFVIVSLLLLFLLLYFQVGWSFWLALLSLKQNLITILEFKLLTLNEIRLSFSSIDIILHFSLQMVCFQILLECQKRLLLAFVIKLFDLKDRQF